jgi:squalene-hopene/tetraprenyl-beta-curcumene cyclase
MYAVEAGLQWLLHLQNRDGGIPTFCRGWGALPFDRSAPELTAHAMQAWTRWQESVNSDLSRRIAKALPRALKYLANNQRADGAWIPLWFGNERAYCHENPVFGTARTLIVLNEMKSRGYQVNETLCGRAMEFLHNSQLPSGGWGGDATCPESLEETAIAVEALTGSTSHSSASSRGIRRLLDLVESNEWAPPAPIGLYFARLWYFERLYPLIFTTSALSRIASQQF